MRRTSNGDRPVSLAPDGITCRTSPSPNGFYFKSADTGEVFLYDETSERCVRVLKADRPFSRFTVSPDGRSLALDFKGQETSDLMIVEHFR